MFEYEPLKFIPCHQYMDLTCLETVLFIIVLIKYFVKDKRQREINEKGELGRICQVTLLQVFGKC